jgi:hypothetical protein
MMECIDSDPEQLAPSQEVSGWSLTPAAFAAIDAFPRESICNPVAPEFMAPRTAKRMEPWPSAWDKPRRRVLEVNHEEDRTFCK